MLHFPIVPKLIFFRQPHTNWCLIDLTLSNFFLPMQTKQGDNAAGLTAQEFEYNFKRFYKVARDNSDAHKEWAAGGVSVWLDNARWHGESQRMRPKVCPKIPPYSPDIMKVIEHPWNTIKREFRQRLSADKTITDLNEAAALFERVAHEVITPESVAKDVATVRDTLKAIQEAKGGHVPKRFR